MDFRSGLTLLMQESACIRNNQTGQSYTWVICLWQQKYWNVSWRISPSLSRVTDASRRAGGKFLLSLRKSLEVFKTVSSVYWLTSWTVLRKIILGNFLDLLFQWLVSFLLLLIRCFKLYWYCKLLLMVCSSNIWHCGAIGLGESFISFNLHEKSQIGLKRIHLI